MLRTKCQFLRLLSKTRNFLEKSLRRFDNAKGYAFLFLLYLDLCVCALKKERDTERDVFVTVCAPYLSLCLSILHVSRHFPRPPYLLPARAACRFCAFSTALCILRQPHAHPMVALRARAGAGAGWSRSCEQLRARRVNRPP